MMYVAKGILSILLSCIITGVVFSGNNNKLAKIINDSGNDTTQLRLLEEIIKKEAPANNALFSKSLHLYDSLTQYHPSDRTQFFLFFYKAEEAYYEHRYKDALALYKKSAQHAKNMDNVLYQADAQQNTGLCYHFMGNYNRAYSHYQHSVALYDSLGSTVDLANAYQNIGIVFTDWQQYERSVKYYRKALKINEQHNNRERVAALLQNMGVVYYYWQHYQQAISHYQQSFKIFQELQNLHGMGSAYMNMGVVYEDLNKLDKALEYYQKAFVTLERFRQPDVLAQLQYNIGNVYYRKDHLSKALLYLDRSLTLARKNKLYNQQALTLEVMSSVYEEQREFSKALQAHKAFHVLNDSLFSHEKQQAFDQMVAQYELKARENKIDKLEQKGIIHARQMERQGTVTRWISFAVILLAVVSGLFLFFYLRQRKLTGQLHEEVKSHQKTTNKLEYIKSQLEGYVKKHTEELWTTNHKLKESILKYETTFSQLLQAKEKAEQADTLKSSFLRNMSHEVRTPLNAILGFSQMIASEQNEAKRNDYVTYVEEASQNLLHIIEDVLDFSKLESGHTLVKKALCDARTIIQPLENRFRNYLARKKEGKIPFHAVYHCHGACYVETDVERVRQLLSIFVENACKFTMQGSITIGVKEYDQHLQFYCTDTGVGIAKDHQKIIFECFRQIDTGTTRRYGGNGLGLSLAQKIATLLHTEVQLESELGKGSTFSFLLPKVSQEIITPSVDEKRDYEFNGKVILVVEDKPMNFYILEEYLKDTKATLQWCKNGKEAVELFQTPAKIDLILMDIQMPVMDGLQAARLIRKDHPAIPIIAQTAYAFAEEEHKCLDAGCNDTLVKPIAMHQLLKKLRTYLFPAYV
ncbi:MAG: tetratricopeptide repeat protein [Bacteroidales bacterium]